MHALLPLRQPLQLYWSLDSYRAARYEDDDRVDHGESSTANVRIVDAAIRSRLFWCYTIMLDVLAFLILMLMGWSEDCPCHYKLPGQEECNDH